MKTKPKTYVTAEEITEAERLSMLAADLDRRANDDAEAGIRFATAAALKRQEATDCRVKAMSLFFTPAPEPA